MMKKKIFSVGVFAEGMRKLRIFGCISTAVMLLIELAPVLLAYTERKNYGSDMVDVLGFWTMCPAVTVCAVCVTPIMMFILFSGFNKRAFCDFFHALPYTRQCIFVSLIAAVMTWVVGISAVSMAVGITARLMVPWVFALSFAGFGTDCLILFVIALLLCGAIALASSVTGTFLSNVTVTGLILFFPRYIAFIISSLVIERVPVMLSIQSIPLLSPRYNLLVGGMLGGIGINGADVETYISIIYTAVIALIYLLLAAFLFVRRKSEIAGQSAPGRKTQAVIRIALTLVPSALGTAMIMSDEAAFGTVLWILSVIVYFAYEILSTMRWHNLPRAVPYLLAVIVLNGVMVLSVAGISQVSMNYTPAADEVKSVRLMEDRRSDYIADKIASYEIKDKEIIRIVCDALADNVKTYADGKEYLFYTAGKRTIAKNVVIKEGLISKYRYVYFDVEDYERILSLLNNDDELKKEIMTLPESVENSMYINGSYGSVYDITAEGEEAILEVLQKEVNEKGFEAWLCTIDGIPYSEDSEVEVYDPDMDSTAIVSKDNIYINYTVNSAKRLNMNITIDKSIYPKTYNFIMDLVWERAKTNDYYSRTLEILKMIADGEFVNDDIALQYFRLEYNICSDSTRCYVNMSAERVESYYDNDSDEVFEYDVSINGEYGTDIAEAAGVLYELLDCGELSPSADRYNCVTVHMYDGANYYDEDYIFCAPIPEDFDLNDYRSLLVNEQSYWK